MAIDAISKTLGFNYSDISEEKEKALPNLEKIAELKQERTRLLDERNRIYFGDKELMQYVIDNYSPKLRSRYGLD